MRLAAELDALLAQDIGQLLRIQRDSWDSIARTSGGRLLLFGAGSLGRRILADARRGGMEPIAFLDNNERLWGKEIDGLPVLQPELAAKQYRGQAIFVLATYNSSRPRLQLQALGAFPVIHHALLFAGRPDVFLPHCCLSDPRLIPEQADDIRKAFSLMADDEMRRIFLAQLRYRLFMDFDRASTPQTEELRETEYFPPDLYESRPDEVLMDCGAYDGDTLRRFLGTRGDSFSKIYACEPDPASAACFEQWHHTLPRSIRERITLARVAVGAHPGMAKFTANGSVRSQLGGSGAMDVEVVTIDGMTQARPPTLIKMDVEGEELEALSGARHTIEAHTPVLAVCIYHAADHLWRVPLLIASMTPHYRFYLRAHAEDCWDTTCYAVPKGRGMRP